MRWMWLAVALCWGCAGPKAGERPSAVWDRSDESDSRWVVRGTTPQRLFMTNGDFGVWVDTASGLIPSEAFLFREGALYRIADAQGPYIQLFKASVAAEQMAFVRLREGETLHWSFDLRTGELNSLRRYRGEEIRFRIVIDPKEPRVAIDFSGVPKTLSKNTADANVKVGPLEALLAQEDSQAELQVARSVNYFGVFRGKSSIPGGVQYEEVLAASKEAHDDFWKTDIEVDGPAQDQLAIRTMLYYLRRGSTPKLPPFGASNAKYRGARFWDSEAWMLPMLAIVDRKKAAEATRWRLANLGEYIPWEAAVGGKDVTPKEFGNALHVAGWVAWWMGRARDLQLVSSAEEKKVLEAVFPQFYKAASDDGRGMAIKGVESPDEGKLRDNDLVTNLLAKRVARTSAEHGIADGEDLEWFKSIVIPRAHDGLPATYDNDLIRGYQQTAALLAIYPLDENFGKGVAERMFDRYADLTSDVGPAMSESIHATIAARLGRQDAYPRWRKSWQTYTDSAMMFHERRNKQDAYFMTGAAGCLQTVLFGFAGMRLTDAGKESATGNLLPDGYPVAFRPNLPDEWKSITLRNIFLGPRRATVRIDHSSVSIE